MKIKVMLALAVSLSFFLGGCAMNDEIDDFSEVNNPIFKEAVIGVLMVPNRSSLMVSKVIDSRSAVLLLIPNGEKILQKNRRYAEISEIYKNQITRYSIKNHWCYPDVKSLILESPRESDYMSYTVYLFGEKGSLHVDSLSDGPFTEWFLDRVEKKVSGRNGTDLSVNERINIVPDFQITIGAGSVRGLWI